MERHSAKRLRRQLRPAIHRQLGHGGGQGLRHPGGCWRSGWASPSKPPFGYTSARYTESTQAPKPLLVQAGDAISGEAAINYAPGTNPPWTVAVGPQYSFKALDHDAFVRFDWEYTSRNPWLAPVQDPATVQYSPETYTLSSTTFASLRAGVTVEKWQISAFCDNLLDSRTTTNYQLSQADANSPAYAANPLAPESVQQNAYTWRPRTIGITATFRH